jgi:hypothetical protein
MCACCAQWEDRVFCDSQSSAYAFCIAAAAILSLSSSFWCERWRWVRRPPSPPPSAFTRVEKEGRGRAHTQRSHYYYCEGVTAQTIERKEMRFGPGRTVAALCLQQIKILSAGIRAAAVKRLHWSSYSKCTKLEIDSRPDALCFWRTEHWACKTKGEIGLCLVQEEMSGISNRVINYCFIDASNYLFVIHYTILQEDLE